MRSTTVVAKHLVDEPTTSRGDEGVVQVPVVTRISVWPLFGRLHTTERHTRGHRLAGSRGHRQQGDLGVRRWRFPWRTKTTTAPAASG